MTGNEALCKLSGGKTVSITYPQSERAGIATLRTSEELATVRGVNLPVGAYEIRPAKDSHNNWLLDISQVGTRKVTR